MPSNNGLLSLLYLILISGGVLYVGDLIKKKTISDAQNENLDTKEKLNEIEKEVIKNEAVVEVEKEKRAALKKEMEDKTNAVLSGKDIADFFNKRD